MSWEDPYNKYKQKIAVNYLREITGKRKSGEISLREFVYEVDILENEYGVILGDEFLDKIASLAADLRQNNTYRYRKDLTRKEEESLLIDNIEKLYGEVGT